MLYKILGVLLLAAGLFLGGYYSGKGDKEVQIIEKVGETRTVYKDRIVTVTKIVRPDGTVEETTKTEEKEGSSEETTVDRDTHTKPALSDYSLGAKYWRDYESLLSDDHLGSLEVTAGRRLLGEVWLDMGVRKQSFAVGVSVNF